MVDAIVDVIRRLDNPSLDRHDMEKSANTGIYQIKHQGKALFSGFGVTKSNKHKLAGARRELY